MNVFGQKKTGAGQSNSPSQVRPSKRHPKSLLADADGKTPFEYVQPKHARNEWNAPIEPNEWEFRKLDSHWIRCGPK